MHPYQGPFVVNYPVNRTDPSGLLTEEQVQAGANGGAEFSCNCGWIDWSHVQVGLSISLLQRLRYARNNNYLDAITNPIYGKLPSDKYRDIASDNWGISVTMGVGRSKNILGLDVGIWIPLFDKMAIVPDSSAKNVIPTILAMSIYMDAQEQFEVAQGTSNWGYIPHYGAQLKASYFSEEDLPSDFLGFYMAVLNQDFNLDLETQIRPRIRELCNIVSHADSLKVWRDVYNNGKNVEKGWRHWYPRFVPLKDKSGCELGICKSQQWPRTFSILTSQRIHPQTNGTWWWYSRPPRYAPRIPFFSTEQAGLVVMPNTIDYSQ